MNPSAERLNTRLSQKKKILRHCREKSNGQPPGRAAAPAWVVDGLDYYHPRAIHYHDRELHYTGTRHNRHALWAALNNRHFSYHHYNDTSTALAAFGGTAKYSKSAQFLH